MQNNIEEYKEYADEITGGLTPFVPFVPFAEEYRPQFPTDKLPSVVGDMVECLAESTQTPEEMGGLLSLGVLATLFQSRFLVEVTPDWQEPLCLYCAAVAPPAERKSAVIDALTKPIYDYEKEERDFGAAEIEKNRAEKDMLERKLQAAKQAAMKDESKRREALELAAELAEFKVIHERRWIVDDTTPEKLADMMDKQGGCLTVCSAEGGVFDAMHGRYEKTGGFDVYLKAHAGDPIVVDRIGRGSNYIQHPRLTMLLTIQPEVLTGLMGNAAFRGRGLCGRFLFAVCSSKVGSRKVSPPPIPEEVKANYRAFVRRALSGQSRGVIRLSPDANRLREAYQEYVEGLLGDRWEYMRDWGGKHVGAMIRIAALLHCAQTIGDPTEEEIGPETVNAAMAIAEFLGAHAEAAYRVMCADDAVEDAKYLWRRIGGADEISKRDLFNMCKGHFRSVENMEPAVQALISRGYLAETVRLTGGRPSRILLVNPRAKVAKAAKAG